MSAWPTAPLRDLCKVNIGRTPSRNEPAFWAGSHPWASIRDLASGDVTETREQISDEAIKKMPPPAPEGTLLASFKLTIGRVGIARQAMHHNEAIVSLPIVRPDRVDRDYLRYLLPRVMLATTANNAVLGKVLNKATLQELPIPLPPLEEQRRIVGMLDRAAEIRRRAGAARAKARAIIPALFLDIFGDPATNPKGWPMVKVGKLANVELRNGISPSKSGTVTGKVLTLSAVTRGAFDPAAFKESLFTAPLVPEQSVSRSSFLICRGNGNPELVGRGTFPTADMPDTAFPDTMIALRGVSSELSPGYLSALWATDYMRTQIKAAAKTTNGTYKISQGGILSFELPLPPLPLQTAFAEQAQRLEATAHALDTAAAKVEAMCAALSAEMFA